jgi:hypothetical protein
MGHSVVYPGNLNDLIKKWEEQRAKDWNEDHDKLTFIANGQCARLPQALTSVGHTSRWQPGERVIDVARTLKPGTVIANFKLVDGRLKYPNAHGYHAAIFVRGEGFSVVTGKPSQIIMFDQWIGSTPAKSHAPGIRPVRARTDARYSPCDNANEFFVVIVP